MVQTLTARDVTEAFSIVDNTTTGNCTLFTGTTSGTVSIATDTTRTGAINIGNASSSGPVTIEAGGGVLTFGGSTITIDPTPAGNIEMAPSITSGQTNISIGTGRTGAINIGNASSSGDITLDAGSGTASVRGVSVVLSEPVNAQSASADFSLLDNLTSGAVTIDAGVSRTGAITVGNSSSSGIITIDAGSSALNLAGTNHVSGSWTPGMSDTTGNVANTTNPGGAASNRYVRFGNIVTCSISVSLTNKTGLTAGEVLRITGLPFAQAYASQGNPLHGPLLTGAGGNTYRLDHEASGTSCGMHKNDSVSVNGQILVSDVAASGLLKGTFTYFV